jgi:hypothetical protein
MTDTEKLKELQANVRALVGGIDRGRLSDQVRTQLLPQLDKLEQLCTPEPAQEPREWWINVYGNSDGSGEGHAHTTKVLANTRASSAVKECIHVREVVEGSVSELVALDIHLERERWTNLGRYVLAESGHVGVAVSAVESERIVQAHNAALDRLGLALEP